MTFYWSSPSTQRRALRTGTTCGHDNAIMRITLRSELVFGIWYSYSASCVPPSAVSKVSSSSRPHDASKVVHGDFTYATSSSIVWYGLGSSGSLHAWQPEISSSSSNSTNFSEHSSQKQCPHESRQFGSSQVEPPSYEMLNAMPHTSHIVGEYFQL